MPTVNLGYIPREQFDEFHVRPQRWAVLVAHRRAGKTVACIADLVNAALKCDKPNPRYAYISPYFVQSKAVAWMYLSQFTRDIPGIRINISDLSAEIPHNGARVTLYGADNYDRLRGQYFDGIILDEYADMSPAAWEQVIRPALSDRKGWAVFIGTPKGRNGFFQMWEQAQQRPDQWFSAMLKASETRLIPQDELDDLRAGMTPEVYAQELECSFEAAILGAYYAKEVADAEGTGRVTTVQPDPHVPVQTAWDLGIADSTAIWWFQVAGNEVRVIDHYENSGYNLDHYVGVIRAKPYKYGPKPTCWVPHDAKVRSLETGRTRIEHLQSRNCEPRLIADHTVMDGINSARVLFPRMWFDKANTHHGLECLRQYRAEFDDKIGQFKKHPKHDWTSHTADAFRYLAMAWLEQAPKAKKQADAIEELKKPKTWADVVGTPDTWFDEEEAA